jgi:hypothetical protein
MSISKSFVVIFLISICTPGVIVGQRVSTTKSVPATSGLLVGRIAHQRDVQVLGFPSLVQYETLWIVRDGTGAHIAATLPDIIVPRKTGFWHVGIQHTCQFNPPTKGDATDHGNISTVDLAYAVPVEKPAILDLDSPLCEAATSARVLNVAYDPVAAPNGAGSNDPGRLLEFLV